MWLLTAHRTLHCARFTHTDKCDVQCSCVSILDEQLQINKCAKLNVSRVRLTCGGARKIKQIICIRKALKINLNESSDRKTEFKSISVLLV